MHSPWSVQMLQVRWCHCPGVCMLWSLPVGNTVRVRYFRSLNVFCVHFLWTTAVFPLFFLLVGLGLLWWLCNELTLFCLLIITPKMFVSLHSLRWISAQAFEVLSHYSEFTHVIHLASVLGPLFSPHSWTDANTRGVGAPINFEAH